MNQIETLIAIASGDGDAFKTLFMHYYPKVKAFAKCLVKSDSAAEDIAQDLFLKLWEKRADITKIERFDMYIYRSVKNGSLNFLSKSCQQSISLVESEIDIVESTVEEEYYAKEKELLIKLIVNAMPAQRRKIFELSRYVGMTNSDIADTLNLSKKTVENHLTLALREIRQSLAVFTFFL